MCPTGITSNQQRTTSLDSSQQSSHAHSSSPAEPEVDSLTHEGQQASRAQVPTAGPGSSPLQPPSTTQGPASRETSLNREPPPMENSDSISSENVHSNSQLHLDRPIKYEELTEFEPHQDRDYLKSAECIFSGASIDPTEDEPPITQITTFLPFKSEKSDKDPSIKNKNGQQFFRVYEFSDIDRAYKRQKLGGLPSEGWREVFVGYSEIPSPSEWRRCDPQKLKKFYEEQPKIEKINNEKELKLQSTFGDLIKKTEYNQLKEEVEQLITDIDSFIGNDNITPENIHAIKKRYDDIFNSPWMTAYAKRHSETIEMQEFKEIILSENSDFHKRRQPAYELFYDLKTTHDKIRLLPIPTDIPLIPIADKSIQQLLAGKITINELAKMHPKQVMNLIRKRFKFEKGLFKGKEVFHDARYLVYDPKPANLACIEATIDELHSSYPHLREIYYRGTNFTDYELLNKFNKFRKLESIDTCRDEISRYDISEIDGDILNCISGYSIRLPENDGAENIDDILFMLNHENMPRTLKKINIQNSTDDNDCLIQPFWDTIREKIGRDGTLTFHNYTDDVQGMPVIDIPDNLRNRVASYQLKTKKEANTPIPNENIKYILSQFPNLKEITLTNSNEEKNSEEVLHDFIESWGQGDLTTLLQKGIQIRIGSKSYCPEGKEELDEQISIDPIELESPAEKIYVPNETRTAYKLAEDDEITFC
jgi:hypothetical protein